LDDDEDDDSGAASSSSYSPIFLPIDRNYESKYLFHFADDKTRQANRPLKERVYAFLEHPVGWTCLAYHATV
jgi:hypothetical protein